MTKRDILIIVYFIGYFIGWPLVGVFFPALIWPYRISLTAFLLGVWLAYDKGYWRPGR